MFEISLQGRVVAGMIRYPAIRERVRKLGPALFEDEHCREIAVAVLKGVEFRPEYMRSAEMRAVAADVLLYIESTDEEWATHLLDTLIVRRELPQLSATLRWAAQAIEAGKKPRWIMGQVIEAARRAHCDT